MLRRSEIELGGTMEIEFSESSGRFDGMEGRLDRLYWEGGVQLADVTLADGRRITLEILRRETAAAEMPAREIGS